MQHRAAGASMTSCFAGIGPRRSIGRPSMRDDILLLFIGGRILGALSASLGVSWLVAKALSPRFGHWWDTRLIDVGYRWLRPKFGLKGRSVRSAVGFICLRLNSSQV